MVHSSSKEHGAGWEAKKNEGGLRKRRKTKLNRQNSDQEEIPVFLKREIERVRLPP